MQISDKMPGKPFSPGHWDIKKENIRVDTNIEGGKLNVTISLDKGLDFPDEIRRGSERVLLLTMNESIFKEGLISEDIYNRARTDIEKLYA